MEQADNKDVQHRKKHWEKQLYQLNRQERKYSGMYQEIN